MDDPEKDEEDSGLVAVGGDLRPQTLLAAYRRGVFPWPIEGMPLTWFSPPERALLEWKNLHIPRSLAKAERQSGFVYSINRAFNSVIERCSKLPRPGQSGTWITPAMVRAYQELHRLGHAHSVEAWQDQNLVGGLYGVEVDGAFAGESMFYLRPNASKLSLLFLMRHLHKKGLDWIDIQMMTPHLEALGATVLSRTEFLKKLERTRSRGLKLFESPQSQT